ncbi:MAG TPA: ribonuclease H-like domain-containing protein [Terriglobales bacterium]|nr:ribonuclease H-like domain-containing protein [Terriglobales bacterium]
MKRQYLAFDIETAKVLPRDVAGGDILAHRPLGITCAAALATDKKEPQLFYSRDASGMHSAQMCKNDLSGLIDFLTTQVKNGYTIVTHNGLGFDFDVLAEESGRLNDCKKLAVDHVDIMFHVFCCKGFTVGLDATGEAIGLRKLEGIEGWEAPQLWKDGKYETVLKYVGRDCRIALEVANKSERRRSFSWITQHGTVGDVDLPNGWLTVRDAKRMPLPDTSWMSNPPWSRSKFAKWLG